MGVRGVVNFVDLQKIPKNLQSTVNIWQKSTSTEDMQNLQSTIFSTNYMLYANKDQEAQALQL